jgi:uncharacterized Zn finger protein
MPYWNDFEPSKPRRVSGGIKAHNQRGELGKTWWSQRWRQALERITDSGRLSRGRSYARQGQVLDIEESGGIVHARVQGSRPKPYAVTLQLRALPDAEWERVLDTLAGEALFSAQLLAGEMPAEIEQAFTAAKTNLFPTTSRELITSCSCPDLANPCKHIAAVYYLLGEAFDDDPFMLFRLRGRSQEQVFAGLNARRGSLDTPEAEVGEVPAPAESLPEPLPLDAALFWSLSRPLDDFPFEPRSPETPLAVLQLLGQPAFLDISLQDRLAPVYAAVTRRAVELGSTQTEVENEPDD